MSKKFMAIIKKGTSVIFSPFSKSRIFYQILVIILIMLSCVIIEGYSNLGIIDRMQRTSLQVYGDSMQISDALLNLNKNLLELKINYLEVLNNMKEEFIVRTFYIENFESYIYTIEKNYPDSAMKIEGSINDILKILKEPISKENYGKLNNALYYFFLTINNLDSKMKDSTNQMMVYGTKFSQGSKEKTVLMLLISFLISFTLGLVIATSISKPLKSMVKVTNLLAAGDLSINVKANGCYEATALVGGFNRALAGLRKLIQGINQESEFILIASKDLKDASIDSGRSASEVARAMEELTSGSNEQSDQINRTVSTVTELSELVRKVSMDTAR